MKPLKVDHVGIAVKSLDEAVKLYTALGLRVSHTETVEDQKVKTAFLPVGETNLELLESTSPDGPVARTIEKRGEGVHHVAICVDNIDEALQAARRAGLTLVDEKPRTGAHGARIAFVHPKSTRGVLLELCEKKH
ncbi:MAG: methylmalonyl-CoA epimerase [Euryarchaeota archaeon]|nr:methylmalonyl-CoA epimerase [Euryarchaeota archaeon]